MVYDKEKIKEAYNVFGYVRIAPPMLDTPSYRQYQGIYCSLCKQLGKRYGVLSRFILNYDMTFLALLRASVKPQDPRFSAGTCSFSPVCKRLCCHDDDSLAEAADLSVLLTYYKLLDNAADERGVKQPLYRFLAVVFKKWYRRAKAYRPLEEARIAAYMKRQAEAEQARVNSVDRAADSFACFLGQLLSPENGDTPWYRFGYCLGRWVYLCDAIDDLPKDVHSGNYNPYAVINTLTPHASPQEIKLAQQNGLLHLNNCLAVCKEAYEQLPVRRFDAVFRNILYVGMPAVQNDLLLDKKKRKSQRKKRVI